jgi:hypothetical protein
MDEFPVCKVATIRGIRNVHQEDIRFNTCFVIGCHAAAISQPTNLPGMEIYQRQPDPR